MGRKSVAKAIFFEASMFLLGALIFPAILLSLILVNLPLLLYWYLNRFIVYLLHTDAHTICSGVDHIASNDDLYKAPSVNMIGAFVVTGDLTMETAHRMITPVLDLKNTEGYLEYGRLKQFLVRFGGLNYWAEEKDFNLADHIRCVRNNDSRFTENDLDSLLSELQRRPWTRNKSMWELVLVKNFEPSEERRKTINFKTASDVSSPKHFTVLVLNIHHSIGDAYSMSTFVKKWFDVHTISNKSVEQKRSSSTMFLAHFIMPFKMCSDMAKLLFVWMPNNTNSWTYKKQLRSNSAKYSTVVLNPVSSARIKSIKNKFSVSFQGVLHSVWAGLIRSLMKERGQFVPKKMNMMHPLPAGRNHPGGMVNYAIGTVCELFPGEVDPVVRLAKSEESLRFAKRSTFPVLSRLLAYFMSIWPSSMKPRGTSTLCITGIPENTDIPPFENHHVVSVMGAVGSFAERSGSSGVFVNITFCDMVSLTFHVVEPVYPDELQVIKTKLNAYLELELVALEDSSKTSEALGHLEIFCV